MVTPLATLNPEFACKLVENVSFYYLKTMPSWLTLELRPIKDLKKVVFFKLFKNYFVKS
jgi:hypothetical protein